MNIAIFQKLQRLTFIWDQTLCAAFTFDLVLSTTTVGLFNVSSIACYINNIDYIDARLFLKKNMKFWFANVLALKGLYWPTGDAKSKAFLECERLLGWIFFSSKFSCQNILFLQM